MLVWAVMVHMLKYAPMGLPPWGVVTFMSGRLREGWCRNRHG